MAIYRVKQFMWAITAKFKPIDEEIIDKYLNKDEKKLFKQLSFSDMHHCIRVCNDALTKYKQEDIDIDKLAKIALLHDIGKASASLNIIDKSVIVIVDKITNGKLKKYNFNKKIDTYYNHPKKSVALLNNINRYDSEFLEAIEQHHYKEIGINIYLKIVKECDDNN
ncbi:HD domain-containing protein [Clostridium vincentii]|uniref:HD domain protein n=1 Tax=Clostridium vincentii TaxID=52704 RepID=A0A2T0BCC8_9CLOT|nr:HD domain-containing protein [Clostridium vincentii]PRR81551.1 HD domain protein [Clostridium vincentii]